MAKQDKSLLTQELTGIVLISVSILIACSLFSYDYHDISLFKDPPTDHNLVGKTGAWFAFCLYGLFGWTSNLLPLLTMYLGFASLFRVEFNVRQSLIWLLGFILSFSCLIQVLGWGNMTWSHRNNVFVSGAASIGGAWGYFLGQRLFWTFLKHGAVIVFLIGSSFCFFKLLQVKVKEVIQWIHDLEQELKKRKRDQMIREGDPVSLLKAREEELAERQRALEAELALHERKAISIPPTPENKLTKTPTPFIVSETKSESPPKENSQDKFNIKVTKPSKPKSPVRHAPQPTSFGSYQLPSSDLLHQATENRLSLDSTEAIAQRGALIEQTLKDFDIEVKMGEITQGATITRYEVIPSPGVRVEKIVNLQNNLALTLKAEKVNILAPVAGKGTVGIEVPNASKAPVLIRELIESREFQDSKARIPLALGKDVYGKTLIADLAEMPHLLIAGSTGAGKSVCINSILSSLLFRFSPEDLRLILVDPKVVELQIYNSLPHLVVPVVSDPKKVIVGLRWVIREMEKRYKIMAKVGVRNIWTFNHRPKTSKPAESAPASETHQENNDHRDQPLLLPEEDILVPDKLPYIVVVIDELADLMMTASVDAEDAITRITQLARAAGIHLIVATQTPRANVVTGTIKTNLPSKIAFRVSSAIDSRVILDENGAENLLGKGDMLYKSSDSSVFRRAQGAYISDDEVRQIVDFCSKQAPACFDTEIHEKLSKQTSTASEEENSEDEELVEKCIDVIRQEGRASTSLLQRRLRLGYTRAARIMDLLEDRGVVGPSQGSKDREILIRLEGAPES